MDQWYASYSESEYAYLALTGRVRAILHQRR